MTDVYVLAAIWVGLALLATVLSIWLRIATAMSEIIVGTVAQLLIGAALGTAFLGTDQGWIKFLSSIGAVLLTFLAGVELDPAQLKRNWREATALGLAGFFAPFLGCSAAAHWLLHWT
jgi:glutathione-regulated potassium-efflux system ancillary protein KefC